MELIFEIIRTTSASFDFALVISINVASYIIINIVNDALDRDISKWAKRGITCVCIIALSIIYHMLGACDDELILNSAILAPVFWSWIGKPILSRFRCINITNVSIYYIIIIFCFNLDHIFSSSHTKYFMYCFI